MQMMEKKEINFFGRGGDHLKTDFMHSHGL